MSRLLIALTLVLLSFPALASYVQVDNVTSAIAVVDTDTETEDKRYEYIYLNAVCFTEEQRCKNSDELMSLLGSTRLAFDSVCFYTEDDIGRRCAEIGAKWLLKTRARYWDR
jgi:hypothetical protein